MFTDVDEELAVGPRRRPPASPSRTPGSTPGSRSSPLLEDRERIATDLHDTVIQRLFATGLSLQATARLAERPEVAAGSSGAVDDLDDTVKHIRSVIFGLETAAARRRRCPPPDHDPEREASGALGFQPESCFDGPVDTMVDEQLGRELLATMREALSNVARHAGASSVTVEVEAGPEIVLRVSDDGRGLPAGLRNGLGLRNMASRAEALGGRFDARPGDGGGTVVEWAVPPTP